MPRPLSSPLPLRVLLLIAGALFFVQAPRTAEPESKRLNVLFISSWFKGLPAQNDVESGLDQVIEYTKGKHDVYFEFLESPRIDKANAFDGFEDHLKGKYKNIEFDFIVALSSRAISFLAERPDLFPQAHHILIEYDTIQNPINDPSSKTTYLAYVGDAVTSLKEIVRLEQPRRVILAAETTGRESALRIETTRKFLAAAQPAIEVECLIDRPFREVAARLKNADRDEEIALFLLIFTNRDGRHSTPYSVVEQLNTVSRIPIYSYWSSLMGSGVVGGKVMSLEKIGRRAGEIMLGDTDKTENATFDPMACMYDWNALERWGISPGRLPEDAVILNRPPDILDQYYWQIFSVLFVIASLCVLSILLLQALNHRNAALAALAVERANLEIAVRERTRMLSNAVLELGASEEKFKTLSAATFECVVLIKDGKVTEVNPSGCEMFGYDEEQFLNQPAISFIAPESRELVASHIASDYTLPYNTVGLKKDGTVFPLQIRGRTIIYKGLKTRVTALRDLTLEKEAEEEIKTLQGILPICASCKKIRDDQGYWGQIEKYISDHSEAVFSHGLCPDCQQKYREKLNRIRQTKVKK